MYLVGFFLTCPIQSYREVARRGEHSNGERTGKLACHARSECIMSAKRTSSGVSALQVNLQVPSGVLKSAKRTSSRINTCRRHG